MSSLVVLVDEIKSDGNTKIAMIHNDYYQLLNPSNTHFSIYLLKWIANTLTKHIIQNHNKKKINKIVVGFFLLHKMSLNFRMLSQFFLFEFLTRKSVQTIRFWEIMKRITRHISSAIFNRANFSSCSSFVFTITKNKIAQKRRLNNSIINSVFFSLLFFVF